MVLRRAPSGGPFLPPPLRRPVMIARLALVAEEIARAFWPFAATTTALVSLAALDPWRHAGFAVQCAVSAAACLCVTATLWHGYRRFTWPRRIDALHRLETDNGLEHRPLSLLGDSLAAGDDALWQALRWDATARLPRRLRLPRPRPGLFARDRFRLRYALPALLAGSLFLAGWPSPHSLLLRLIPSPAATARPVIEAWIVPPDYTGKTIIPLLGRGIAPDTQAEREKLSVPAGSRLLLRASGLAIKPRLSLGGKAAPVDEDNNGFMTADAPLETAAETTVTLRSLFTTLLSQPLTVVADAPPVVLLRDAATAAGGNLRLTYTATDDYGLTSLTLTVSEGDDTLSVDLPARTTPETGAEIARDLTSFRGAGQFARLTLTARDAAGQETISPPLRVLMPERRFRSPVAQRLILARKRLIAHGDPITRLLALNDIVEAARRPDMYRNDTVAFTGMVVATRRLSLEGDIVARDSLIDLLWSLAVRIEDGGLQDAADIAAKALQALQEAANDPATTADELGRLTAEAQAAMRDYLRSLQRDLRKRAQAGQKMLSLSPEVAAKLMNSINIGDMMRQMQALAQAGDRNSLQKMAEQLRQSLEDSDPSKSEPLNEKDIKALEALDQLPQLIRDQQALLDSTQQLQPDESDAELSLRQAALRDKLQKIAAALSAVAPVPPGFTTADAEMKNAAAALRQGSGDTAVRAQQAALKALEESFSQSMKSMAERMQQQMILLPGGQGSAGSTGPTDPFGRPMQESDEGGTGKVDIPADPGSSPAQTIIRTLRDRSNDAGRPPRERDYIDRLLDIFNP